MLKIGSCTVFPSYLEADLSSGKVFVLANGSAFLYLIETNHKVSVKFQALVLSVSYISCPGITQQPFALCCLANREIIALSLKFEDIKEKKQSEDILSSLFEDGKTPPNRPVHDGRDHSVCLYLCQSQSIPQSAMLYNNNLFVMVRTKENTFLRIYHSSSTFEFHHHQFPALPNHLLFQYNIGSCASPSLPLSKSIGIPFRPVLHLVCCQSAVRDFLSCPVSTVSDAFFCQLFGIEFSLAHSTIAITGSRTGTVSFLDTRGLSNPSFSLDCASLSNTLCNLDQPVVGVHVLHLPVSSSQTLSPINNALLLVGQRGRLILFSESHLGKVVPIITEFHVAGPILSSLVVQGHSFVYSSIRGIYRVCLEPSCLLKSSPNSTATLLVPQIQFKSPTCVLPSTGIMFIAGFSPSSISDICSLKGVSVDGRVVRFIVRSCRETKRVSERGEVGTGIKSNMSSIVRTQERTAVAQQQLKLVNSALKELNQSLSTLSSVLSDGGCCVSCTLSPETERVGVKYMSMFVRVELKYTGEYQLERGWYLLSNIQCSYSTISRSLSLSLTGLRQGDCLKHRLEVNLEHGMPVTFTVTATLCYNPTHLHSVLTKLSSHPIPLAPPISSPCGASILLSSASFDALHFFQPCSDNTPALVHHSLGPSSPQGSYSLEMFISQSSLVQTNLPFSDQNFKSLLRIILPQNITIAEGSNSDVCRAQGYSYDGSIMLFEAKSGSNNVNIKVTGTGSASCLSDIFNSTSRRLNKAMIRTTTPDTLSQLKGTRIKLQYTNPGDYSLQEKSREMARIVEELTQVLLDSSKPSQRRVIGLVLELFHIYCNIHCLAF